MGSQPCSLSLRQSTLIFNSNISATYYEYEQTNFNFQQQPDIPSGALQSKILKNRILLASNNLLNRSQNNKSKVIKEVTKPSECKQNIQNNQQLSQKTHNQLLNSMDKRFFQSITGNTINFDQNLYYTHNQGEKSFMQSVSCDQQFMKTHAYKGISIRLQDFIKLKKAPVRKSYSFLQKIGQGSYGSVYKALSIKTKQIRAIKSIKHKQMGKQKKQQFFLEMDILKELDHPNIIKLYEVYDDKTMYHVVTQYCIGGPIIDFVLTRKKYSQQIVRQIFKQLLTAINYMHLMKVVHRDLKLQNIVLLKSVNQTTELNDYLIKIIDFGAAARPTLNISKCKSLVGTISYMAPQIMQGFYNQKCDIWSAGVILYILITGKSPFKGSNKESTMKNIKNKNLLFEGDDWTHISKDIIDLLQKMLVKDHEQRIDAQQALRHKWFSQQASNEDLVTKNQSLINNLSRYYRGNNFISKIQSYLSFVRVNQEQRRQISQLFRALDKNHDGTIQVAQLKLAYRALHQQQNLKELEQVVSKIDKNLSGKIDLAQFTSAVIDRTKLFVKDYLIQAFDYFDTNSTGFIQKNQLKQLLDGCQIQEIDQLLIEIDTNSDYKISKTQFLAYFMKKNILFTKKISGHRKK